CTDEQLARYVEANIAAVRELRELVRPELALANHLVMGPVILARALAGEAPYAVKIHGSALEYTVKAAPERFAPYAREGLARARGRLDPGTDELVAFVGKLIVSKGVDLLLAAWPLVLERAPRAKLVVVGFGAVRGGLEALCASLAAGDLERASELARAGRAL